MSVGGPSIVIAVSKLMSFACTLGLDEGEMHHKAIATLHRLLYVEGVAGANLTCGEWGDAAA